MRVQEAKEMLLAFTQGQIYYHARSLEKLTQAYQTVQAVEPEEEGRAMRQLLLDTDKLMYNALHIEEAEKKQQEGHQVG